MQPDRESEARLQNSLAQFTEIKIQSFYFKHKNVLNKYASLNNSYDNSHRNHMNRIFYENIFRSIDRSLRSTGRMPWIILRLRGFLCVREAGRRYNKITAWYPSEL